MAAPRISLAGLMGLVVVVGLGLASLRFATVFWTAAAAHVALGYLAGAVLGATLLRGPERGFWAGFALFGWAWMILVNWSWLGADLGHDLTSGLGDLAELVHAFDEARTFATEAERVEAMLQNRIKVGNFIQIGRALMCLSFALAGGFVGRAFAGRAEARRGGDRAG